MKHRTGVRTRCVFRVRLKRDGHELLVQQVQIGWVLAGAGGSGLAGPVFVSSLLMSFLYSV